MKKLFLILSLVLLYSCGKQTLSERIAENIKEHPNDWMVKYTAKVHFPGRDIVKDTTTITALKNITEPHSLMPIIRMKMGQVVWENKNCNISLVVTNCGFFNNKEFGFYFTIITPDTLILSEEESDEISHAYIEAVVKAYEKAQQEKFDSLQSTEKQKNEETANKILDQLCKN